MNLVIWWCLYSLLFFCHPVCQRACELPPESPCKPELPRDTVLFYAFNTKKQQWNDRCCMSWGWVRRAVIFVAWCPQVVLFVCKHLIFSRMNSDSPFLIGNNHLWLVISLLSVRDKTQELCTCDGGGKRWPLPLFCCRWALAGSPRSKCSSVTLRSCISSRPEDNAHELSLDFTSDIHVQAILPSSCSQGCAQRQKPSLCFDLPC